jgi:integrase
MNFISRVNKDGTRTHYYYDFGRKAGQRPTTGIFTYTDPKTPVEKAHNKEALALLKIKQSQLILEQQSTGTGYIPSHKFKANFLDYYQDYVVKNRRAGNRHMEGSLRHLKAFLNCDYLNTIEITENFCKRFRQYLLDRFTGDTPANYYARFKWVLKSATKDGYFRYNPSEDVKTKTNPSKKLKANLEVEDYSKMLSTPCLNAEVRDAFIFSCYTGLRYVDVRNLSWSDLTGSELTTRIIQKKTGRPVTLSLHPVAQAILHQRSKKAGEKKVFRLPSNDGCNKILGQWMKSAQIDKEITWSCARLSFSILLQDKNVDDATVAYLMGHTSTDQVRSTYKRHRPKDQAAVISLLPALDRINSNS